MRLERTLKERKMEEEEGGMDIKKIYREIRMDKYRWRQGEKIRGTDGIGMKGGREPGDEGGKEASI